MWHKPLRERTKKKKPRRKIFFFLLWNSAKPGDETPLKSKRQVCLREKLPCAFSCSKWLDVGSLWVSLHYPLVALFSQEYLLLCFLSVLVLALVLILTRIVANLRVWDTVIIIWILYPTPRNIHLIPVFYFTSRIRRYICSFNNLIYFWLSFEVKSIFVNWSIFKMSSDSRKQSNFIKLRNTVYSLPVFNMKSLQVLFLGPLYP